VIRIATEGHDFDRVRKALRQVRAAGADIVVFSIHWGPNMREVPPRSFVDFAHAMEPPRIVQDSLRGRGLSRIDMRHDTDISIALYWGFAGHYSVL